MQVKEKVYQLLSEKLTNGELCIDDKITEAYLVDQLKLSRTPIREALIALSSEGIIHKEPNKGYYIKQLSLEEIEELYAIIGLLDGKAAYLACDHVSDEDLQQMQYTYEVMNVAINNEMYTKYNELQYDFHQIYLNQCPNKTLTREIDRLKHFFVGKGYSKVTPDDIQKTLKETNEEHRQIVELFKNGKKEELQHYIEHIHWSEFHAEYELF